MPPRGGGRGAGGRGAGGRGAGPAAAPVAAIAPGAAPVLDVVKISQAIPVFYGRGRKEDPQQWLQQAERVFEATEVPQERWISIAVLRLEHNASTWYEALSDSDVVDWDAFKQALLKQYQPADVVRRARAELSAARQHGNVHEYYNYLTTRFFRIPDMKEDEKIHYFMKGLRPDVRKWVNAAYTADLAKLVERAIQADDDLNYNQLYPEEPDDLLDKRYYSDDYSPPRRNAYRRERRRDDDRLYRGRRSDDSPRRVRFESDPSDNEEPARDYSRRPAIKKPYKNSGAADAPDFRCFNCGERGHMARSCPHQQNKTKHPKGLRQ